MTGTTAHPRKQLMFALLSAADFALTMWLLERPEGGAYEANPVAAWWLAHFGWVGLAAFKTAVVLLVVCLTCVIARHRPRAAGRLLQLGCACLLVVVTYSAALGAAALRESDPAKFVAHCNEEYAETNRQTAAENRRYRPFFELSDAVRQDVIAGRRALREAAERLHAARGGCTPALVPALASEYGCDGAKLFACWLVARAADSCRDDPAAAGSLVPRLVEEFREAYGPLPRYLRQQVAWSERLVRVR